MILAVMLISAVVPGTAMHVSHRGDGAIASEPGKIVTAVFRVVNNSDDAVKSTANVILPAGWRIISQERDALLEKNQTEVRLISFQIPLATPAGEYHMNYMVYEKNNMSHLDSAGVDIHVKPLQNIELQVLDEPDYAISEESYHFSAIVANKSNVADSVIISFSNSQHYAFSIQPERFFLAPGESRKVMIMVQTENHLRYKIRHRYTVIARFTTSDDVYSAHAGHIDILPRMTGENDRYHRLPIQAAIRQVVDQKEKMLFGTQVDIKGAGTLDDAGRRNVRFRLMGPDIYDKSSLAEHDEYYVTYWTDRFFLQAGDLTYSLSPLTEFYRYGRGVEGRIHLNKLSAGAFYQKPRWSRQTRDEAAVFLKYAANDRCWMKLNYLRKVLPGHPGTVMSLEGQWRPSGSHDIEYEVALGNQAGKHTGSYRAKMEGAYSRVNYHMDYIHADAGFPGYYRDTEYLSARVAVTLTKRLAFSTSMARQRKNFELDTTDYAAPYARTARLGIHYKLGRMTSLHMDWLNRDREDRLPQHKFDYQENAWRIRARHQFFPFSIAASAEFGMTDNRILKKNSRMDRYSTNIYYAPSKCTRISGYVNYDRSNRYEGDIKNTLIAGVNMNLRFLDRTSFYLRYQSSHHIEDYYQDRNYLECSLTHVFSNRHQLILLGRYGLIRHSLDKEEKAVSAEYSVPLSIPVSKKKSVGVVKGQILDIRSMRPLQDILVRINGSTAVTDVNGSYIFPALKPGSYHLRIDKTTLDFGKIPALVLPLQVDIRGGEEYMFDIGVTESARFSGRIMVYRVVNDSSDHFSRDEMQNHLDEFYVAADGNGNQQSNGSVTNGKTRFVEDYGLPEIMIEIKKDDGEIQRRITGSDGCFVFEELRPGSWEARIYTYNVPAFHMIEQDQFFLELQPEERKDMLIRVIPKRRRIRFINQGGTIIEKRN